MRRITAFLKSKNNTREGLLLRVLFFLFEPCTTRILRVFISTNIVYWQIVGYAFIELQKI